MFKMFRPRVVSTTRPQKVDMSRLDDGLHQLRQVASDVSKAAASAATLLQEEQRRTRACYIALNSASDGIVILDREGCIYFCNDQFMKEHGINHYDDVVGLHILKVLPRFPEFPRVWASCRENNTEVVKCPTSRTQLTIVPMMNGLPEPIYYTCTFKAVVDK